jgi:hypothetical protein
MGPKADLEAVEATTIEWSDQMACGHGTVSLIGTERAGFSSRCKLMRMDCLPRHFIDMLPRLKDIILNNGATPSIYKNAFDTDY